MGDLTVVGWAMVALYFATSLSCLVALSAIGKAGIADASEFRVWCFVAIVFFVLGTGRLFDFQAAITAIGRTIALDDGWYRQRRFVQQTLIVGVALACVVVAITLAIWFRDSPRPVQFALIGTIAAVGFAGVRAASLHQMDMLGAQRLLGLRINWIVELGAIGLVLIASRVRHARIA